MLLRRFFRHLWSGYWQAARAFPARTRVRIAGAIAEAETGHSGEICVVIEAALTPLQLWRGLSARERAIDVFSERRVWDTVQNNGLLIYLLLGDRTVDIVADRGLSDQSISPEWQALLVRLQQALAAGEFELGCLAAIEQAGQVLRRHFPLSGPNVNELPNQVQWL